VAKRYYDPAHQRLVYLDRAASPDFWDDHWRESGNAEAASVRPSAKDCLAAVRRFLPQPGAKVLEGGCGNGGPLLALHRAGYDATGVDFAPETVAVLNRDFPELKVTVGDIRRLDFDAGTFDGYWSGGVIEHFWRGYDEILAETHRVLRPGGYGFFTFPSMSALRKFKSRMGSYPTIDATADEPDGFYQFAIAPENVVASFRRHGFEVLSSRLRSGTKGFAEEVPAFSDLLMKKRTLVAKVARRAVRVLEPFCGHSALVIVRKPLSELQ
jgi:SAM-dependent methyltransferase